MIPKINKQFLKQGIDIPSDPLEYGRLVLRVCPSNFEYLPYNTKRALTREAIAIDPALMRYCISLRDDDIWPIIKQNPSAIQYVCSASQEMWQYVLAIDPQLAYLANQNNACSKAILELVKYGRNELLLELFDVPEEIQLSVVSTDLKNITYLLRPCLTACRYVMERDPSLFPKMYNPPPEICQMAFDHDIQMIRYILRPTIEMVNRVIREAPELARHVRTALPEEFCDHMLDTHGYFIERIKKPSQEQALRAFETYPNAISHIHEPTEEMCWRAIVHEPSLFFQLSEEDTTEEMLWHIIKNHADVIDDQEDLSLDLTTDMIRYAIENCPNILKFSAPIPEELCYEILDRYPLGGIHYIPNVTDELFCAALDRDPKNIKYIGDYTEARLYALTKDPRLIYHSRYREPIECFVALLLDPKTIHLIHMPIVMMHRDEVTDYQAVARGERCSNPDYIKAREYLGMPV